MKIKVILSIILVAVTIVLFLNWDNSTIDSEIEATDFSFEMIILPVKAHVIKDSSELYSSTRDDKNILELFDQVNRIWSEAGIYFKVEEIVLTQVGFEAIPNTINGDYTELVSVGNFIKS